MKVRTLPFARRRVRVAVAVGVALQLAVVCGASAQRPRLRADACVACHLEQPEERLAAPARDFTDDDVHGARGFGCVDCHGRGGGADGAAGLLSKPARERIPLLCGRCHSDADFMKAYNPSLRVDQLAEYRSSEHGRRLFESGDSDVATCVDCHPAHRMRRPSDTESTVHPLNVASTCARCHGDAEKMGRHGLTAEPPEAYARGVHGRLMEEGEASAPTCNDCHGNHGAAPPGIESVRNVCGQCHATMEDRFRESGHSEAFADSGLAGCAACHGNHDIAAPSDALLLSKAQGVCSRCHHPGEPGATAFVEMHALLDSLKQAREDGAAVLARAQNLGMEVSQPLYELEDVATAITKARTAIHTMRVDAVREEVAAGLEITSRATDRGREALTEHRFRRVGLAFSVALIALLVLGLALKIREMERGGFGHTRSTGEEAVG